MWDLSFIIFLYSHQTLLAMPGACYKYCFVLSCLNNSKKNPDKYFFRVPYNQLLRDKWCIAVDRAAASIKQSSTAFCCSDHFDVRIEYLFIIAGVLLTLGGSNLEYVAFKL